jgi:hypothetical protein
MNNITELIGALKRCSNSPDLDNINILNYRARDRAIKALQAAIKAAEAYIYTAEAILVEAITAHRAETEILDRTLCEEHTPDTDWIRIIRKRRVITAPANSLASDVPIAPDSPLTIQAIIVQLFDDVKQDGNMYYIATVDHFAIYICGKLFHGNIGIIYTDDRVPKKIRDCRFDATCVKKGKCDYYHNPMKYPKSADRRNYIANSFTYSKRNPHARRYGSLDSLSEDMVGLSAEEISRFNDQTMHNILCALLLKK